MEVERHGAFSALVSKNAPKDHPLQASNRDADVEFLGRPARAKNGQLSM
jgi:hypothetical protein